MLNLVGTGSHLRVFKELNQIDYLYSDILDANRAEDGISLRYRFGYERGYNDSLIASYLDDRPCSFFEMMVALALRCEEHIMEDPDAGDRVGTWFWEMVDSLGLGDMNDISYDEQVLYEVIDRFHDKRYFSDGRGGLFTVPGYAGDIRKLDIWYQMCAYLEYISNKKGNL